MKRVLWFALAALMAFSLFGCGKAEQSKEVEIGGTLKTDMVELTFTEFGFADEGVCIDEESSDFCKPTPFPYQMTGNETMDNLTLMLSQETYVRATEEMAVVYMEYVIKNTSDKVAKIYQHPAIVYNETDSYVLDGYSKLVMSDLLQGQHDGVHFAQNGDTWTASSSIYTAGSETVCRAVAKIPVEVKDNSDKPLVVTFSLPSLDDTMDTYTVILR